MNTHTHTFIQYLYNTFQKNVHFWTCRYTKMVSSFYADYEFSNCASGIWWKLAKYKCHLVVSLLFKSFYIRTLWKVNKVEYLDIQRLACNICLWANQKKITCLSFRFLLMFNYTVFFVPFQTFFVDFRREITEKDLKWTKKVEKRLKNVLTRFWVRAAPKSWSKYTKLSLEKFKLLNYFLIFSLFFGVFYFFFKI